MSLEDISSPKHRKKKYQQKFCKRWVEDPAFSGWLEEKEGIPFCSVCNRYFREGTCRNELDRHLKTSVHEENAQKVRMEICRICLVENNVNFMSNIYDSDPNCELRPFEQINLVGGINIPENSLPERICSSCSHALKEAVNFRILCKKSSKRFPNLYIDEFTEPLPEPQYLEDNLMESTDADDKNEQDNHEVEESPKEQRTFICDVCGQQFDKKNRLSLHIRWHMKVRPYKCDECEKSFAQKCDLRSHMRVHSGEKPYKCSMCEKAFSGLSAKLCHERTHRNERPYKCDVCGKTFTYGSTLNKHKKTHTGEKHHFCEPCNKAFAESHHLKAHLQTIVHSENVKKCSEEGVTAKIVEEYEFYLDLENVVFEEKSK